MSGVIRQKQRTEEELKQEGFKRFSRKKQIVMARSLPASESPLQIDTSWGGVLTALAGDMICYNTEGQQFDDVSQYDHWSVKPHIFDTTYADWDENFQPTLAQRQLLNIGCKPYYKSVGVWAKSLDSDVYVQGLEHDKPVLIPENRVLAIGAEGEPWAMGDETFHDRYDGDLSPPQESRLKSIANRLIKFLKGN
ncbi:MAG: hypothetical protein AAF846_20155 [Chloroflexota bacterium]